MSRLTKLFVFGLLFLGFFVSAQNDCSKAHYTYDSSWLCVETVYSPTTWTFYGQFYLYEGEYGDYPVWHIIVKDIETTGVHHVELECWHDIYFGGSDSSFSSSAPVNPFLSDWTPTTHPWTHCLNINSNFVLYATTSLAEQGFASWDPLWEAAGCPNIYYGNYDGGVPSLPKVKLTPTWISGKQSPSQVSAPVSSSKSSSPRVFVRSSVSRVSKVLSKASSYFRQRAFKR